MTELDHIIDVHRRENARAEAAGQVVGLALFLIGYGLYRLIGWLL